VGWAIGGWHGALTALLWAGLVRITLLQHVGFVMKAGVVYKRDGSPVQVATKDDPAAAQAQGEELQGY